MIASLLAFFFDALGNRCQLGNIHTAGWFPGKLMHTLQEKRCIFPR
jgi:hypothetical protein